MPWRICFKHTAWMLNLENQATTFCSDAKLCLRLCVQSRDASVYSDDWCCCFTCLCLAFSPCHSTLVAPFHLFAHVLHLSCNPLCSPMHTLALLCTKPDLMSTHLIASSIVHALTGCHSHFARYFPNFMTLQTGRHTTYCLQSFRLALHGVPTSNLC